MHNYLTPEPITLEVRNAASAWHTEAIVVRVRQVPSPRPEFATWHIGLKLEAATMAVELEHILLEEAA